MKNKVSLKIKKILFYICILILSVSQLSAKSKKNKDDVYIKYVHPRIYEFDLCDTENSVFLSYNKNNKLFDVSIDFSKYVQNDLPQAGDKVIFYYKGYATKDGGSVKATVTGDNGEIITDEEKTFAKNLIKKEVFDSNVSFVLNKDVKHTLNLYLWSTKQNVFGQIDQFFFKFKRVVETTNTQKEAIQEQNASKKNIEIVEVKTEITKDEDINALVQMDTPNLSGIDTQQLLESVQTEKQKLEEQQAEQERLALLEAEKKKLEEEKRLQEEKQKELERIKAQKEEEERIKNQLALEKALEQVKTKKSNNYEKEFLNDYMIFDEVTVQNNEDEIETIVENPDEKDSFGRTLLMKAAKAGNDWQISTLLKSGANVNLKDNDGWTALMYAVRYQESISCVDLLIDAGADIKTTNNYGTSALMIACCYNNNPEIIKKLLSYYTVTDKDVLKSLVLLLSESHTSEFTSIAKLEIFMELSVPLNTFYEGKTPLMYAAEYGNSTKIIKILIDNNAITSIRSTEGKTAYDYACDNKNLKHDSNYWLLNKK